MIELSHYKNIDNAEPHIQDIIRKIESYKLDGSLNAAYDLIKENAEVLKPYMITNESFNKIEFGIYTTARDAMLKQKIITSDDEPEGVRPVSAEWLQPYIEE